MTQINWSLYQKKIFHNVHYGSGNTAIIARSGSAKTTSLIEATKFVPKGNKILLAAFSKEIAEELKRRIVNVNIDCMTLHSLGYRAVRQRFGNVALDNKKCLNIITSMLGDAHFDNNIELMRLVSFCKATLTDAPSKIIELMDKYDIEPNPYSAEDFAELTIKVLAACKKQTNIIDFNDMIYFPFIYNLNVGKWDYIFIDEAQDMNFAQLVMGLSAAKHNSRTFVFLDDRQAIFGFAACDMKSVQTIIDKLNPTKLALPISYRCPLKVIQLAQKIVPDIEAAPNAINGEIEHITQNQILDRVKAGDYIISRTNAPLIGICMSLLKNNVPANILGRDIGANLLSFIKKSKSKTIDKFYKYLENWKQREIKRLSAEKKDISNAVDKVETLYNLCEGCNNISDLKNKIEKLFSDETKKDQVQCSTVHKCKGLECQHSFMLTWTFRQGNSEEEDNIYYVALTRTKEKLHFVHKNDKYMKFDN